MLYELMAEAYRQAKCSPDQSNQNGAVLVAGDKYNSVVSKGFNGFGLIPYTDENLADRNWKLAYIEHAERAALFSAARIGTTEGSILVCPWACCTDCGRAIARMGVKKLIVHQARMDTTPERWVQSVKDGLSCLEYYGVAIEYYTGGLNLPEDFTIRANGEDWSPVSGKVLQTA